MDAIVLVDFKQSTVLASSDHGKQDSRIFTDPTSRMRLALCQMRQKNGNPIPVAAQRILMARILPPYIAIASDASDIPNFEMMVESLRRGTWQRAQRELYPLSATIKITGALTAQLFREFGHPGADQRKWDRHQSFEVIAEMLISLLIAPCDVHRLSAIK